MRQTHHSNKRLALSPLVFSLCALASAAATSPPLNFPLRFSASLVVTANTISAAQQYPPRERRMRLWYDYPLKVAKAEVAEGYEAAKLVLRRYDQRNEYVVRHDPINDCTRSHLGETMPFPDLPAYQAEYLGEAEVEGARCDHWLFSEYNDRIHLYMDQRGAPRRLVQVYEPEDGKAVTMLTYDYTDVVLGAQDIREFDLPEGYSHSKCDRHVGGFPYLHIFHYFVRF